MLFECNVTLISATLLIHVVFDMLKRFSSVLNSTLKNVLVKPWYKFISLQCSLLHHILGLWERVTFSDTWKGKTRKYYFKKGSSLMSDVGLIRK